ncbi:hypothetical protein BDW66DRAFT_89887 [Aspergillus desertorum]
MYTPGCIRLGARFRFERCFKDTLRKGIMQSFSRENTFAMLAVPFLAPGRLYSYTYSTVLANATSVGLCLFLFALNVSGCRQAQSFAFAEVQVAVEVASSGIVCFHGPLCLSRCLNTCG